MTGSNTARRILIIDDEAAIRNTLRLHLEREHYEVGEAISGHQGLELAAQFHPHLIILDLGLPDLSGVDVLKALRQWTNIPVIVLTVLDSEESKVALLDAGADDYLSKPFGANEFLARVRVCLRNHGALEATPIFVSGDLQVDLNTKEVRSRGHLIRLTSTEFSLLRSLIRSQGKIVPQHQLLVSVWGEKALDQVHYLRIYIGQLRKKIELHPSRPAHILTEPGVGYRIV